MRRFWECRLVLLAGKFPLAYKSECHHGFGNRFALCQAPSDWHPFLGILFLWDVVSLGLGCFGALLAKATSNANAFYYFDGPFGLRPNHNPFLALVNRLKNERSFLSHFYVRFYVSIFCARWLA